MARRTYEVVLAELELLERAMRDPALPLGERARMTSERLERCDEADDLLAWLSKHEDA